MKTSGRIERLLLAATVTLLLLVSVLLLPQDVGAWPFYLDALGASTDDFVGKYPTWPHPSGTSGCLTCHATYPPTAQFNPYGSAFRNAKQGTAVTAALNAIAGQDSDGDGVPNGVEILFNAYPGDLDSKPSLPGGVSASDGTLPDKVQVTWSAYPNAAFQLHRADSPDGAKTQITSTSGTQHADTTAVAGKTYHYWVRACSGAWCTGFSSPDAGLRKVAEAQAPSQEGPKKPVLKVDPSILRKKIQVTLPKPQAALAYKLSIQKIEFSGQGQTYNLPLDGGYGAKVSSPGVYEVRVLVKNTGNYKHQKGSKKCGMWVVGGKQVGTYGHSYGKTFLVDVPDLAPNEAKYCYVKLDPNITDAGNYFVYPSLKP